MRIIKAPEDISKWSGLCKCTRCNAELEYSLDDVKGEFFNDFREESYWTYKIVCPVCKLQNKIPNVQLSNYAQFYIQSKK